MSNQKEPFKKYELNENNLKRLKKAEIIAVAVAVDKFYRKQFRHVESFSDMLNKEIMEFNAAKSKASDVQLLESLIAERDELRSRYDETKLQLKESRYKVQAMQEKMEGHKTLKRLRDLERLLCDLIIANENNDDNIGAF